MGNGIYSSSQRGVRNRTNITPDQLLEWLLRRLRPFVFKRSSRFLFLGPVGAAALAISTTSLRRIKKLMRKSSGSARLRPNSIGSLRQKSDPSVAVPRTPYGGSLNQPVTLTLRTPSRGASKTHGVKGMIHVKSVEAESPSIGVVWKFGEKVVSSDVVLVIL
ncbi:hypothetical protein TNCV_1960831 [Trichonephila clavipes]|nr:hypothetical protein TNCV_1960831 [Trichonephila clavipes]